MHKEDEQISYATNKKGIQKMKIVLVGDQYVGKTSIITRFIKNTFDISHNPTIGIDFVSKNVTFNGKILRLQLWDTAGQERFRSLIPNYIRDCAAALIIYDITNQQSYKSLEKWVDFIKENRGDQALIYILGNKKDLSEDRVVDADAAKQKFKQLGIHYNQTSAKTGDNIQQVFTELCADLLNISVNDVQNPLQIHQSKIVSRDMAIGRTIGSQVKASQLTKSTHGQKLSKTPNSQRRIKQKDCC